MRQENSFKEFIWQHVEMAFNKGFDDNVGRNPVAARFEVCPLISVFSLLCLAEVKVFDVHTSCMYFHCIPWYLFMSHRHSPLEPT